MVQMAWLNIPREFQGGRWAVSTLKPLYNADGSPKLDENGKHKRDKAPRSPRGGHLLEMDKPDDWATFSEAANAGYPAIGRLLLHGEGFVGIDLDACAPTGDPNEEAELAAIAAMQRQVYQVFDSYAERSTSGDGCHILIHGSLLEGRRRRGLEIYGHRRYLITTGDVVRDVGITNQQANLDDLLAHLTPPTDSTLPASVPGELDADAVIQRAGAAANGGKFQYYMTYRPGQGDNWSDLDAALIQMIVFWTQDHDVILEVFRRSTLYREGGKGGYNTTEKYEEQYLLQKTIAQALRKRERDEAESKVYTDQLKQAVQAQMDRQQAEPKKNNNASVSSLPWPDGLLGDVANYILESAYHPFPEVGLAGAITFMAGIAGRQYNVSGSGLTMYTALVAETGRGKEAANQGVSRIMTELAQRDPNVRDFIGPGVIASGQALLRTLGEEGKNSVFSFIGELGHVLKILTDPRASSADLMTSKVLLQLYSASGADGRINKMIYSNKEKDTEDLIAPNFSWMGDTTPDKYFKALNTDLANEGFLPRILTLVYDGPRTPANPFAGQKPPRDLIDRLAVIVQTVKQAAYERRHINIPIHASAIALRDQFEVEATNRVNNPATTVDAALWSRAGIKALRLSALHAIGRNPLDPLITEQDYQWGLSLTRVDLDRTLAQFEAGETGEGEVKHESHVVRACRDFLKMSPKQRITYGCSEQMATGVAIPFAFLRRRLRLLSDFQTDRRGVATAVKSAVKDAMDGDLLVQLSPTECQALGLKAHVQAFVPGPAFKV